MFKVGDVVRLKRTHSEFSFLETAVIERFLSDVEGGVKLETPLAFFRYWNVNDLELVEE